MWTRGRDTENPGKFAYELWEGFDLIERVGGFSSAQEADKAAEMAQRRALFPTADLPALDDIFAEMDLEDLRSELLK